MMGKLYSKHVVYKRTSASLGVEEPAGDSCECSTVCRQNLVNNRNLLGRTRSVEDAWRSSYAKDDGSSSKVTVSDCLLDSQIAHTDRSTTEGITKVEEPMTSSDVISRTRVASTVGDDGVSVTMCCREQDLLNGAAQDVVKLIQEMCVARDTSGAAKTSSTESQQLAERTTDGGRLLTLQIILTEQNNNNGATRSLSTERASNSPITAFDAKKTAVEGASASPLLDISSRTNDAERNTAENYSAVVDKKHIRSSEMSNVRRRGCFGCFGACFNGNSRNYGVKSGTTSETLAILPNSELGKEVTESGTPCAEDASMSDRYYQEFDEKQLAMLIQQSFDSNERLDGYKTRYDRSTRQRKVLATYRDNENTGAKLTTISETNESPWHRSTSPAAVPHLSVNRVTMSPLTSKVRVSKTQSTAPDKIRTEFLPDVVASQQDSVEKKLINDANRDRCNRGCSRTNSEIISAAHYRRRHRHRERSQNRAMRDVARWLQESHWHRQGAAFADVAGEDFLPCRVDNAIVQHRHVHEHYHHHYHYYTEQPA